MLAVRMSLLWLTFALSCQASSAGLRNNSSSPWSQSLAVNHTKANTTVIGNGLKTKVAYRTQLARLLQTETDTDAAKEKRVRKHTQWAAGASMIVGLIGAGSILAEDGQDGTLMEGGPFENFKEDWDETAWEFGKIGIETSADILGQIDRFKS